MLIHLFAYHNFSAFSAIFQLDNYLGNYLTNLELYLIEYHMKFLVFTIFGQADPLQTQLENLCSLPSWERGVNLILYN